MLRRVAAFCRPLRPVLPLVSFPRSRSPVVGVLGLCWLLWGSVDCFAAPTPHSASVSAFAKPSGWRTGLWLLLWGSFDGLCCPLPPPRCGRPPSASPWACGPSDAPPPPLTPRGSLRLVNRGSRRQLSGYSGPRDLKRKPLGREACPPPESVNGWGGKRRRLGGEQWRLKRNRQPSEGVSGHEP